MADPIDTSTLGPIKIQSIEWAEATAKAAMEERFKNRLATAEQRNGYEVGYYEALLLQRVQHVELKGLLVDNLEAWEGEEDSVQEEHADLIERLQKFELKS